MSEKDERGRTTTAMGESEAHSSAETGLDARDTDSLWSQFAGEWHLWVATAAAILVTVYFHLTEGLVTTAAEKFYAVIFLMVAVAVAGYGLHRIEDRRVPL